MAHKVEREGLVEIELDEQQRTREEARERDALRVQVAAGQRADQVGDALPLDAEAGRELIVAHLSIWNYSNIINDRLVSCVPELRAES